MQIGEKIKNYRKTAGLTQEQVADYLDVSTPGKKETHIQIYHYFRQLLDY